MIVISFLIMMNHQKRNVSKAEEQALTLAISLNGQDWVGELNNMTGFSRQLVYTSRQQANTISKQSPQLSALAVQLLDESRRSAQIVNGEKLLLLNDLEQQLKVWTKTTNDTRNQQSGLSLPWVTSSRPAIQSVDIGYIEGIPSNVYGTSAIPGLIEFDLKQKYLNSQSRLYESGANVHLPEPDDDLHFVFSSLPAPVKGTISPARLASNDEFHKLASVMENKKTDLSNCVQLPSSVQVQSTTDVAVSASGKRADGLVKVTATATAPGATLKLP